MKPMIGKHIHQLVSDSNASLGSLEFVYDNARKPTDDQINSNRRNNGLTKIHSSCSFAKESNVGKLSRWDMLMQQGKKDVKPSKTLGVLADRRIASSTSAGGQQNATWDNKEPALCRDSAALNLFPIRMLSPHNGQKKRLRSKNKGPQHPGFSRPSSDPNILLEMPKRVVVSPRNDQNEKEHRDDLLCRLGTTSQRNKKQNAPRFTSIKKQASAPELLTMGEIKAQTTLGRRRRTGTGDHPVVPRHDSAPSLERHGGVSLRKKSYNKSLFLSDPNLRANRIVSPIKNDGRKQCLSTSKTSKARRKRGSSLEIIDIALEAESSVENNRVGRPPVPAILHSDIDNDVIEIGIPTGMKLNDVLYP